MSGWSDWGSIGGSLPSLSEASGPGQDASLGEGASPSGCHKGSEGGGGGTHLSSSAFIKSHLEMDGRG